jgi:hypothetical protein
MTVAAPPATRAPLAEPEEVAAYLRITTKTLAQWRWRQTGPAYKKVGGDIRYDWADIDAWLTVSA